MSVRLAVVPPTGIESHCSRWLPASGDERCATLHHGVFAMSIKPLVVDFEGLQRMGWPYSPTHTERLMSDTITVTEKVKGQKTRVAREIPNPDRFPRCFKLTSHRNGHRVW